MAEIRKILVPVDFSECSDAAVDFAADLAKSLSARIDLVHAWVPPYELGLLLGQLEATDPVDKKPRNLIELVQKQAREALERQSERLAGHGLRAGKCELLGDRPRRAVVEAAAKGGYDLIVMGSHGRTGVSRFALGSIAEWVVRHASVPVLVVGGASQAASAAQPEAGSR